MPASEDIAYSTIVRDASIVAEIKSDTENDSQVGTYRNIVLSIAAQARARDVACVTTNRVIAYYIKQEDEVVVAIAKDNAAPRVLVAFLREVDQGIKSRLNEVAPRSSPDITNGSQPNRRLSKTDLQTILQNTYDKIAANRDSLRVARSEMDKVKQIVVENIDRLLERGERVNLLVDRTGEMSNSANSFNRQASHLQRKMWFQNVKVIGVGAALLAGSTFAISKTI